MTDDAVLKEYQPRAGPIDETARGNHHHESADDEEYIDPGRAIAPTHTGRSGIDALAPCLERVEKDDEQRRDGAQRLNGQEACWLRRRRLGKGLRHARPDKVPAPARSTTTTHGGSFQTVRSR